MRLHLIGVSALVSAMETEMLHRGNAALSSFGNAAPVQAPSPAASYARFLSDSAADWLEPARDTPPRDISH